MYNNTYNPYNPYMQPRFQQPTQPYDQSIQNNTYSNRPMLNGKIVDSIEVVRATDIPLDGTISYFPLSNGTAIVTKQLQNDGTSKTTVYKPVQEENNVPKYVTLDDVKKEIAKIDLSELDDLKEELNEIKKQLKEKEN